MNNVTFNRPLKEIRRGVRNMIITARVVSKGSIRTVFQEKSFKLEIYDGSLPFSTLVFIICEDCEKFYNIIEVGKVYKFQKAFIAADVQKKSTRNSLKYDMFDPSYITPMDSELPEYDSSLNFNKFELVKINQIEDQHQTYHFDVMGVVMEEPLKDKTKDKEGREQETMKFLIGDESRHTLQVQIRNEQGLNLNLKIFDVILIKSTHVNVYANQKSVDSGSGIILNPDIPEALELLYAFEKIILEDDDIEELNNGLDKSFIGDDREEQKMVELKKMKPNKTNKEFTQLGFENKISVHFYDVKSINYVVQQIEDQLDRVVRLSLTYPNNDPTFLKEFNRSVYSEIEGEIYSASIEKKPYYVACSVCQKKIENYPIIQQCFKRCVGAQAIAKMSTNLNIADATGAISALAFNDQCSDIFGFDAEFLKILDEAQKSNKVHRKDPTYRDFIRQSFTHKYRFRILSGVQIYEKKYSAKHSIVGCTKIDTLQDIQETARSIEMHLASRIV